MNSSLSRDARFALFSAFLDGRCSAASEREVLHLLEQDTAARQDFAELSQMHLWLSEDTETRRVLARADSAPDNIIPLPGVSLPAPMLQPLQQTRRPSFLRDLRPLATALTAAIAALALLPAGAWILQRQFIDPILPGRAPGQASMAFWNSRLTAPDAGTPGAPSAPATLAAATPQSSPRLIAYADQCISCHAAGSPVLQELH